MTTLGQELKKRGPFETPEQEAALNLIRTAAFLNAGVDRLFRDHDLCPTHYNILRILAGELAGGVDGVPVLEVRERLVTPVPDITRLVDKLVKQKLVRRARTDKDRRVVLLRLTESGLGFVQRLAGPIKDLHGQQLGHMTRTELSALSRLLEKARSVPKH